MKFRSLSILAVAVSGTLVCACSSTSQDKTQAWQTKLAENLQVMGARNWVVIAESSYPSLMGPGTITMVSEEETPRVFAQVLDAIEAQGHVKPRIMVSSELRNIDEAYAPGIKNMRGEVYQLLTGRLHWELPHNIIDSQIKSASKQYRILVIKTQTTLPYSNIYIELDSGYWNSDSETELRSKIEAAGKAAQPQAPTTTPTTPKQNIPPVEQLPTLPAPKTTPIPPAPSAPEISTPKTAIA